MIKLYIQYLVLNWLYKEADKNKEVSIRTTVDLHSMADAKYMDYYTAKKDFLIRLRPSQFYLNYMRNKRGKALALEMEKALSSLYK